MAPSAPAHRARPTMNDVAHAAGVSLKTVSRVVNGADGVSPARLERVRAAIEALGFRPNEQARQLRRGTTATIGLILEDVSDPFYSTLTRAVEDVAFAREFMLLTSSSAEDPGRASRLVRSFSSRGIDGLIIAPAPDMDATLLASEIDAGCSVVFVDRPVPGVDADTVLADNRGGAQRGTELLLSRGHRRIAFFADAEGVYTASERAAGYRDALATAGIPFDENLLIAEVPRESSAREGLDAMLRLADPPTAIFAGNNRWSVRLLRELRHRGRRSSFAFIGFDDFELADVLDPGITVIAQDAEAMGTLAAEMLFRRMSGNAGPSQRVQLGTTLIRRGSEDAV